MVLLALRYIVGTISTKVHSWYYILSCKDKSKLYLVTNNTWKPFKHLTLTRALHSALCLSLVNVASSSGCLYAFLNLGESLICFYLFSDYMSNCLYISLLIYLIAYMFHCLYMSYWSLYLWPKLIRLSFAYIPDN